MKKGFTLVEVLTTALILFIVLSAGAGLFASTIKVQRYIVGSQQIMNETSYALEYMSRAIRMAQKNEDSACGWVGPDEAYRIFSDRGVMFAGYKDGECIYFYLDLNDSRLKVWKQSWGTSIPLTSNKFQITTLIFREEGDTPGGDGLQPRINVLLEAEALNLSPSPKITIQTTISQRNLDIE